MTTTPTASFDTLPPSLPREAVAKLFRDSDPYALTLYIILQQLSGPQFHEKDPLLLYQELEEFIGERVSEDVESRIQSLLTLLLTDAFYDDPLAFSAIANTLSAGDPGFDEEDPVTVKEMLWAMYEAGFFDEDPPPFSPAVLKEISWIIQAEDALSAPDAEMEIEIEKGKLRAQLEALGFEVPALP